jgi:uncharacterized cupredoxin-like copper-binding protein
MNRRTPTILLLAATVVAVLVVAGCASSTGTTSAPSPAAKPPASPATPAASTVKVRLSEFAITTSTATLRAGKVTFEVTNIGQAPHEFVLLRTSAMAAAMPMQHGEASEAGHVGEIGDLNPGQSATLILRLRAGHYAGICNFTGHYHAGMHTDFTAVNS